MRRDAVARVFREKFGGDPELWARAPGRVDLMGSHTDYNLGYVLPAAIDRYTKFAAAPRTDNKLNVYSETIGESVEIDIEGTLGRRAGNALRLVEHRHDEIAPLLEHLVIPRDELLRPVEGLDRRPLGDR